MEIQYEQNFKRMRARISISDSGEHAFHWHEHIEIVICLNKGIGLLIDGVQYEIGVGDIAVVGGQVIHKFNVHEDNTRIGILQFSYELLLESGMVLTSVKPVITKEEIAEIEGLGRNIGNLVDMLVAEPDDNEGFCRHLYAGLYSLLTRYFGEDDEKHPGNRKDRSEFYNAVAYVNGHYTEKISVQSIARELYMDRGRLSKLFLKYSGITLNDYINKLRFSRAQKLVEEGMTVTRAALESGFQSLRTYNNVKKSMKK